MKAVIMTAPAVDGSTTSVADIDEPQPGPGQVAIDVAYAGVNFIDVMARRGDPGYASAVAVHPRPGVPRHHPLGGQPVCTICTSASALRGVHTWRWHRPGVTHRSPAEASGWGPRPRPPCPCKTGAAPADRQGPHPPWRVSVLMHSASGGIGSAVSQVAAALGSGRRIGTVGRPDKIAAGLAAGWDEVFAREAGLAEAVRKVAPAGVDVILKPSALPCWISTCRSRHPAGGSSCSATPLAALRRHSRQPAASSAVTSACSGSA